MRSSNYHFQPVFRYEAIPMTIRLIIAGAALFAAACGPAPAPDTDAASPVDALAREYLLLELSIGLHDAGHVDAYFGPAELAEAAEAEALSLSQIADRVVLLASNLQNVSQTTTDGPRQARIAGLLARIRAMETRIQLNQGLTLPFDEESNRLFGTQAPDYDAGHFSAILTEIDALVPGEGSLADRVERFRGQFAIPPDRLPDVFDAAIAECRRRTLSYIDLPDNESFTLEYVTDKPWSGYNWYQGQSQSLIQINTDLPIFISRAVDLGCHEGYPGHHTFNALLEKNLVSNLGWLEFSLYPLFSPQSLIAEGSGNYGINLAFPGNERVEFEKDVLFPLAGLNAGEADRYYALQELLGRLNYAGNEAARDYLNGDISREEAVDWLMRYSLSARERAVQRTKFFDTYRSYVINYNLGKDKVQAYVERNANDQAARWAAFEHMLSTPMLPVDLEEQSAANQ